MDDVTPTISLPPQDVLPNSQVSSPLVMEQLMEQLMTIARISALEEMASGIAHELNQPLGAITTFAQAGERMLNRADPMVNGALEVMQLISGQALSAGDCIRRMRQLFNRDAASRSLCAVDAVLRELVPALELLAQRHGGRLTLNVTEGLPMISLNCLRIQHVLFTMVQNAFEAQDEMQQTVTPIVLIEVSGDRYGVKVAVSDAGTGIKADQHAQIFQPFFTTKLRGTGLGLASTRAIVEAHEGTIGFEDLAPGTRFWFRLPAGH